MQELVHVKPPRTYAEKCIMQAELLQSSTGHFDLEELREQIKLLRQAVIPSMGTKKSTSHTKTLTGTHLRYMELTKQFDSLRKNSIQTGMPSHHEDMILWDEMSIKYWGIDWTHPLTSSYAGLQTEILLAGLDKLSELPLPMIFQFSISQLMKMTTSVILSSHSQKGNEYDKLEEERSFLDDIQMVRTFRVERPSKVYCGSSGTSRRNWGYCTLPTWGVCIQCENLNAKRFGSDCI